MREHSGAVAKLDKAPVSKTGDSRFEPWLPRSVSPQLGHPASVQLGDVAGMLQQRFAHPAAAIVAVVLAAFVLAALSTEPAAAGQRCPKAKASTGDASASQLGDAVACLIGKERRKAGVKRLDRVGSLTRVAEKHSNVMVEEDCLGHRCDGEKPLEERILNSGYPIPGGRYGFGEVTGCSLTPQAMVDAWMRSRVHRKRLLGRPYRDVGIGVAKGKPDVPGCDDGRSRGVYTVIFGWRRN